tara:strand:+ start:2318 stop:2479 length:162 start_codon:yes stop_codon:yes gene_type:complete
MKKYKLLEAIEEASISVSCLLNELVGKNFNDLQKDIEHIQDQITIIEQEIEHE